MTLELILWPFASNEHFTQSSAASDALHHDACVQDPAELWNVDNGQLSKLFDDMVKLSLDNCLVDNRWGAVACPDAKRDPKLATRPPVSVIDLAMPRQPQCHMQNARSLLKYWAAVALYACQFAHHNDGDKCWMIDAQLQGFCNLVSAYATLSLW